MRLIDADRLWDAIYTDATTHLFCIDKHTLDIVEIDISEAPTVDAVQVVRCRDCKNLLAFADGHHSCGFKPFDGGVSAMDFCSRGERREGQTDA